MWFPGIMHNMNRRHFMKHVAGAGVVAAAAHPFVQRLAAAAPAMKRENKSLIILWMGGGPSHMDIWDMKPGEPTGGEFKPIKTPVPGIEICEHMPDVAKLMKHFSIIRSLVTNEGSHERGTYLMHTGYAPNPAVQFPAIGSVLNQQLTPKELALPGFISISRPSEGPGFLGMAYAPFTVQNPGTPPQNINPPADLGGDQTIEQRARLNNRREMFKVIEEGFLKENRGSAAKAHMEMYRKAFDLTDSQLKRVFDIRVENNGKAIDARLADAYGRNGFGQACLLARKLVEAGVTCVEVGSLGGWDNHNNIFPALHNNNRNQGGLVDRLNQGMSALIKDLIDRDLWKNTVLVWMGEFGRTPRINQGAGRDHWARCWSVALGGGNLKGGIAYGSTNKDGTDVKENPCTLGDLFATIYEGIGLAANLEIRDNLGRPRKVVGEKGGTPIKDLLA